MYVFHKSNYISVQGSLQYIIQNLSPEELNLFYSNLIYPFIGTKELHILKTRFVDENAKTVKEKLIIIDQYFKEINNA